MNSIHQFLDNEKYRKWSIIFVAAALPFIMSYLPFFMKISGLSGGMIMLLFLLPLILLSIPHFLYFFSEIFLYLLLITIAGISLFWSDDVGRGISLIVWMLITISVVTLLNEKKMISYFVKTFSNSLLLFCILLYFDLLTIGMEVRYAKEKRFGFIGGDLQIDPNFLALWLSIPLFYFFQQILINKNIKEKLYNLVGFLLSIIFLISTVSRGAFISLVMVSILVVLLYFKDIFKKKKLVIVFSGVFLLVASILIYLNETSFLLKRFASAFQDPRIEILQIGLGYILKDPIHFLFGYGFGSSELLIGKEFSEAVKNELGQKAFNTHNVYLDFFIQTGVIGFIIYIYILINFFKKFKEVLVIEHNLFFICTLTFFLVDSFFINSLGSYMWPFLFGIFLSKHITTSKGKI